MNHDAQVLIVEIILFYTLVLGLHALRRRITFTPFLALLGGMTALMYWVTAQGLTVEIGGISFFVSSTVFYTSFLLGVFVVYLFDGPVVTRHAIIVIIGVSTLVPLVGLGLELQSRLLGSPMNFQMPQINLRSNIVSILATLVDLMFLAVLWEYLNKTRLNLPLWLKVYLTFLGIMWLDVFLFGTGAFVGSDFYPVYLKGTLLSRFVISIFTFPALWAYILWQNTRQKISVQSRPAWEVLAEVAEMKRELHETRQDLEEQKKVQEIILQSERRYRNLFEFAPVAMWEQDLSEVKKYFSDLQTRGVSDFKKHLNDHPDVIPTLVQIVRIIDINQAALDLHESSSKAELIENVAKIFTDKSTETWQALFVAIAGDRDEYEGETVLKTLGGETRHVILKMITLHSENQDYSRTLLVLADITERRQAEIDRLDFERQILHTQKLESLGVLAGGIAHDFNNILMGILGYADLALSGIRADSPVKEFIQGISKSSRKAADLVKQMLAYSGKGKFTLEPIDLNQLIEDTLQMLSLSISKKASLQFEPDQKPAQLEGDPSQLQQIVMNLVINASEAIGEKKGVITLRTGSLDCDREYLKQSDYETRFTNSDQMEEGSYVFLEVSDDGSGISQGELSKIFDPFFTTKFTGRGLGLSAVLGIVSGHNGLIKVESTEDEGTTFKVLFPLLEDEDQQSVNISATPEDDAHWQGSGTFLIADDEKAVRRVGEHMIRKLGFDVITAVDGEEAIQVFTKHADKIVGVLLDLTMPQKDGAQVFKEIRRINPDVRVILSSGYNEQAATQQFIGKGLAGFIQKPYVSEDLNSKIREIFTSPA